MKRNDVHFYAKNEIKENLIISYLNRYLPEGAESVDYQLKSAKYFVTVLPESEDFRTSVMISWSIGEEGINAKNILIDFAEEFDTKILSELEIDKWFLISPDGSVQQVEIVELEDGISVADEAFTRG